jgi:hypothetical protein
LRQQAEQLPPRPRTRCGFAKDPAERNRRAHRPVAFLARLEESDPLIWIKGAFRRSANRRAMTDEKPHPTRTDQARQAAAEYASDLREILVDCTTGRSAGIAPLRI